MEIIDKICKHYAEKLKELHSAGGPVLPKSLVLNKNPFFACALGLKPVASLIILDCGRKFSTSSIQAKYKVMVAGASGGIGQPLCLLLKQNPLVKHLALYDLVKMTPGVAVDLSHMNYQSKVTAHVGPEQLSDAVKSADVVVIPAGLPRKLGTHSTRDDLFNANANLIKEFALSVAKNSPKAVIAIITNPVNSLVPLASEVLKKAGVYDPKRVVGVTTLDVVRSSTFIGEINGVDPRTVKLPVIGGHSGVTIIPVLSQCQPPVKLSDQKKIEALTARIQEAGNEVVKAKAGGGSATLSMAYAAARLTDAVLKGLHGEPGIIECTYVKSDVTEATYFSSPCLFGKEGVVKVHGYGKLNRYEEYLLKKAIPELIKNIKTGEKFVRNT